MQIGFGNVDNIVMVFGNKNGNNVGAVDIHDRRQHNAQSQRNHGTLKNPAADAADHAGAVVLGHIGRHGHPERNHRLSGQLLNPQSGRESGNGIRAESVADALGDGVADGDNRELHRHRQSHRQMLFAKVPVEFPVFFSGVQQRTFDADVYQAADNRRAHGADGAERRTDYPHSEIIDKDHVKDNVEQSGENEKIKRRFAVAQCPQKTRQQIEKHHCDDAVGNNGGKTFGVGQNVFGHIHQGKQVVEEEKHGGRSRQGKNGAEHGRRRHRPTHAAVVVSAETLGGDDRQAVGKTDTDHDEHEKQRCGNADRRQRLNAYQPADDDNIGNAVELLKQIANQQRNRKFYNQL